MFGLPTRSGARRAAALALVASLLAGGTSHGSSVDELVASAERHAQGGNDELALRRFVEALSLDGSCERCYVGLGAIRERGGDLAEALRIYTVGLTRRPDAEAPRLARSRVLWRMGHRDDSLADLEEATRRKERVETLRELAQRYRELKQVPAELRVMRRILAVAERSGDADLRRQTSVVVRALSLVAGPLDHVAAPVYVDGARRALARAASDEP